MGSPATEFRVLTFEEALHLTEGRRHLFLGNGFSRALRDDIFAYDALFNRADFSQLSLTARNAFDALATRDFEVVMRALRLAVRIVPLYRDDPNLVQTLSADAGGLREVLVEAIAQNPPEGPFTVTDEQYVACRQFLSNFATIYTVNYDLLLYWALMHDEIGPVIRCDDGFRTPDEGEAEYVTWNVEKTSGQNVFYLHGALHIFDAEYELTKYTWVNTGIRLIDQIRTALRENLYPHIVAEGTSREKQAKILHSMYLSRAYRSFASIGGNLFIYGHSLSENDEHWLHLISKGKITRLFVSLFGDPEAGSNRFIRTRIMQLQERRPSARPLEVHFYDANSAAVWG